MRSNADDSRLHTMLTKKSYNAIASTKLGTMLLKLLLAIR